MSGMTISFTENVTPMLKRLSVAAADLSPAMHRGADLIAAGVKTQIEKLPIPWLKRGAVTANDNGVPEVKTSFTAVSALVSVSQPKGAPLPPLDFHDEDAAPVVAIISDHIRKAIGAGA